MADENNIEVTETTETTETQIFRKVAETKPWFPVSLYMINGIAFTVGLALNEMTDAAWNAKSSFMKIAFWFLIVGNITNLWKAAISKSTRK